MIDQDSDPSQTISRRSGWALYALAVVVTVATLLGRLSMGFAFQERPLLILFVFPIILSAYVGGLGPGLLSTAIAALSSRYFLIPPTHSLSIATAHDAIQWSFLIANGVLISALNEALHRARRRAEAIPRLQDQLARIVAAAPVVMYSFRMRPDGSTCFPYASSTFEKIFGIRPANLIHDSAPAFKAIHPDDLAKVQATIEESVRTMSPWHAEFRTLHPVKGMLWVEGRSSPEREPDGSTIWHGFLTDITERKAAEENLRDSRERYQSLFENMLNGFADCKILYENGRPKDFSYLDVNPAFERITGLKGVAGKKASDVIPGIQQKNPELLETFVRVASTGKPEQFETFVEGLRIWFSISVYSPGPARFVALFEDVTTRKRAEEGLHLRDTALNAAANAIVITNRDGAIEWANLAFKTLSGYSLAEAVGKNPRDLIKSGQHDAAFYRNLWNTILAGQVWRGEIVNHRKDGSLCTEDMTITPVRNLQNEITHFISIKQDITEHKKLEAQLLRNQRLESVGRLASGIAHDLNNILSPVMMAAPLLRDAIEDPEIVEIVNTIESSAQRGAAVIRQLLTFGRGIQGRRVPLQIRSLVREMGKIIQETFPKNITLRQRLPPELPLVNGDETQFHQVLMNLCMNARDAMPEGGTLTLAAEQVDVDAALAQVNAGAEVGPHVVLSVSDTGTGITHENLDKIFDPFFTTKEIGDGTGLGLSTVLGIVRGHKGFIQVQSSVNQGAVFRIFLPASEAASAGETKSHAGPTPSGHGETILFVDDEEGVRRVARQILEQSGYIVLEARNGGEALAVYQSNRARVRVVVTDLMMPAVDGLTLIRELRKDKAPVKIIAISGNLVPPDQLHEIEMNVQAFLPKPFSAQALLHALARNMIP